MFELDKEQIKKFNKWKKKQDKFGDYVGAICGRFTYSFTPTGLGVIVQVTNNLTKDKLDLTDWNF